MQPLRAHSPFCRGVGGSVCIRPAPFCRHVAHVARPVRWGVAAWLRQSVGVGIPFHDGKVTQIKRTLRQ